MPRFCSTECKAKRQRAQAAQYQREGRRTRYHKPGYSAARYQSAELKPYICARCGNAFGSKQGKATYCSRACMAASISTILRERHGRPLGKCHCGKVFKPSRPNQAQRAAGRVQQHCSRACAGIGRWKPNETRRSHEQSQKAKGEWVNIDPIAVCERDGWKCHLCGIRTPKRLRGTTDDRAPEIDHVQPLARGGKHTYENVAVACRLCNRTKGAKPMGQMRLFA